MGNIDFVICDCWIELSLTFICPILFRLKFNLKFFNTNFSFS